MAQWIMTNKYCTECSIDTYLLLSVEYLKHWYDEALENSDPDIFFKIQNRYSETTTVYPAVVD